jgi:flagellar basal-body rod protein FlgF
MSEALAITEIGMLNDVQRLHVISNNLANAGTVGFKQDIAVTRSFGDRIDEALGTNLRRPTIATRTDNSEGTLKYTGNPLDLGLEGAGYFAVQTSYGEAYTRQGDFRLDASGRLVTSDGHAVLGTAGEILLTSPEPRIDTLGRVWEGNNEVAQLRLVSVDSGALPTSLGGGLYQLSDVSAIEDSSLRVRQGFTEASNVVVMTEMIKMIETVRHFEAGQKLLRGYDAMLDQAINVVGQVS